MQDLRNYAIGSACTIAELVEPILRMLALFNPGAIYDPEQVKFALRKIIRTGKVRRVDLMPDLNTLKERAEGDTYALLVHHGCKIFVDLTVFPKQPSKKRPSRAQKEFSFELDNEIYRLENGEAMCSSF